MVVQEISGVCENRGIWVVEFQASEAYVRCAGGPRFREGS